MRSPITKTLLSMCTSLALSACGGSSSGDSSNSFSSGEANTNSTIGVVSQTALPRGEIQRFGAVSIADEQGEVSDLLAGFFELSRGVNTSYFDSLIAPKNINCTVDSDDSIDFEEISASYIPSLTGVEKASISAGDFVYVESNESTYAELTQQPVGTFVFYDLPASQPMLTGTIPSNLSVTIPGADFGAFSALPVPAVQPLMSFAISTGNNVTTDSVFSWTADPNSTAQLRIFTSTAGGFFLEDGLTISCIVPDTGRFVFPNTVKEMIGAEFTGGEPIVSRLQTSSITNNDSVLFLIRESFF